MRNQIIILLLSITFSGFSQQSLLQSGPMLGYSEMKEVMIWVQTTESSTVKIAYWPETNASQINWTTLVNTKKSMAFTAKLIADKVEPGITYQYKVYINDKELTFDYPAKFQTQPLWKYRGDPPTFTLVTGSCAYINEEAYDRPGKPYGSDSHIFTQLYKQQADLMIWLGDNFYYRDPDWNSWTGIAHRNTHTRSIPELQPLLANTHHYAIWDDHDYGPNNSDKGFWNKNQTMKAFELFWPNPSFGIGDMKGAISFFQWGDVDFILLDNRYYRDPNNVKKDNKTMLGIEQLEWLKDVLVTSEATFKIIALGGQFLNTVAAYETYSNNGFKSEREEIIQFIYDHNIKGVVFLTGDRHFTELSFLKADGKPDIYDLTTSSLTAGINTHGGDEVNLLRVENTVVMKHNFSVLEFTGTLGKRKIIIKNIDDKGKLNWKYQIHQQ